MLLGAIAVRFTRTAAWVDTVIQVKLHEGDDVDREGEIERCTEPRLAPGSLQQSGKFVELKIDGRLRQNRATTILSVGRLSERLRCHEAKPQDAQSSDDLRKPAQINMGARHEMHIAFHHGLLTC